MDDKDLAVFKAQAKAELNRLDRKEPSMQVDVEDGKVTVKRGDDKVIAETK